MTPLRIVLDGTELYQELQGKRIHKGTIDTAAALAGGMESGKPSVAVFITLEDGSVVIGETSLALFCAASRAFIARHGDPANEP